MAPKGATWDAAEKYWRTLPSDPGAKYDKVWRGGVRWWCGKQMGMGGANHPTTRIVLWI